MALLVDNIFVNLPVKNLDKSIEFFREVGFDFNPQFTNENATCMIVGKNIYVMLLVEDYFKTFTKKELANAQSNTEAIIAISAESREQVDELVNKALNAGGAYSNEKLDHGFMYGWSFQDLDGHLWEVMYMDPNVIEQA
ncbi:glyoxalase/bleomycin resistance/extradiol dioxygenase family protein [Jeotgalibacillus sp. S-D1]|uniref:VOC family protein n=1 Tax=Jeotgalibacillus sp. S-D1 TaxID=2552189 RepID=UPI001059DD4E|nr:VOC family protein [Jeotgalibacillus sp. S-D1]TDL31327.1 glyoxalase/bleomycin resistance/extradiol dioxygenase family protein [Jeotgalibacillus sp. S-D1]